MLPQMLLLSSLLYLSFTARFVAAQGGFVFPGSSPAEEKDKEDEDESTAARSSGQPECRVVSSAGEGTAPCVFPFVFGGFEFNGCITISDPEKRPWCSTKVDGSGVHVGGNGHWGHCDPAVCPISDEPNATPATPEEEEEERLQGGATRTQQQLQQQSYKECRTQAGKAGHCKPASLCIGLTDDEEDDNSCELAPGQEGEGEEKGEGEGEGEGAEATGPVMGVCCSEHTTEDQASVAEKLSGTAAEKEKQKKEEEEVEVESVSLQDIDSIIGERFGIFEGGENDGEESSPVFPGVGTPNDEEEGDTDVDAATAFHLRFNAPSEEALRVGRLATELLGAASDIQDKKDLSSSQAGIGLRMFNADSSKSIKELCPWIPGPACGRRDMFRRSDGACNNMKEPNYGRAATPYQRILLPEYSEGTLDHPRRARGRGRRGRRSRDLPSARAISNSELTGSNNNVDAVHTTLVMQMGQFVDHDITHTPNHGVGCCERGGILPASFDAEKCFPISVPSDDPFWRGRKNCMSFARSLPSPGLKCGLQFRQQMNQITHWLDSSNVYGSSESMTRRLRRGFGGQLKVTRQAGSKAGALPSCSAQRSDSSVGMCSRCPSCFFAGDVRANEQLNLIVMHTVWMREHNRVARALQKLNPEWDDERLFQEARRITNAEYQHVVYKEWLPLILGNSFMTSFGLWPLSKGYSREYRDDFDPRVTNEFATAAFRFGHSLIPKHFNRIHRTRSGNGFTTKMDLREVFFRPNAMKKEASMLDDLVRGLTSQRGEAWDNAFADDVTDHLFEPGGGVGGLDLVALNIQRGRDHGIPGYNSYREICHSGRGRARTFSDLEDLIAPDQVAALARLYGHVDDVDLYVGGFLERSVDDSLLGPTFKCIVGDQFARLKLGDRFFYDLGLDRNTRFTEDQLREIRKTSMARILCDNTDTITRIQPQAFKQPRTSRSNQVQSCNSINIPSVNFAPFAARRRRSQMSHANR